MLKFSEIFEFSKEKFRKIPILKEFEWFEWFEWFGPSPIEPFNSGIDRACLETGRKTPPTRPITAKTTSTATSVTCAMSRRRSPFLKAGSWSKIPRGSVRGDRANFARLVLGCIEAKFCK